MCDVRRDIVPGAGHFQKMEETIWIINELSSKKLQKQFNGLKTPENKVTKPAEPGKYYYSTITDWGYP